MGMLERLMEIYKVKTEPGKVVFYAKVQPVLKLDNDFNLSPYKYVPVATYTADGHHLLKVMNNYMLPPQEMVPALARMVV